MTLKLYCFILFIIASSSGLSFFLLLFYLDPTNRPELSLGLMSVATLLTGMSVGAMILFFIKKLYYRGDVHISTMNSSIRQAFLLTLGGIMMVVISGFGISEIRLILIIWAALACVEVMMQALS